MCVLCPHCSRRVPCSFLGLYPGNDLFRSLAGVPMPTCLSDGRGFIHFQTSDPGVAHYEINFSKEAREVLKVARQTYIILLNNLVWVRGNIIPRSSPYMRECIACLYLICMRVLWMELVRTFVSPIKLFVSPITDDGAGNGREVPIIGKFKRARHAPARSDPRVDLRPAGVQGGGTRIRSSG